MKPILFLLLASCLLHAQNNHNPSAPFEYISGEGSFDSTIRDQVNTNIWIAQISATPGVQAFGTCSYFQDCSIAVQNAINTLSLAGGNNYGGKVYFSPAMGSLNCTTQPTWGGATSGEILIDHGTTVNNCVPAGPYTASLYVNDQSQANLAVYGSFSTVGGMTTYGPLSAPVGTFAGPLYVAGNITANYQSPAARCSHYTDTNQVHDIVDCAPAVGVNQTLFRQTSALAAEFPLGYVNGTNGLTLANIPVLRVPGSLTNPVIACGTGAGNGSPTCVCTSALNCTNNSGSITVTPNGTTATNAAIFTISMSGTYFPNACVLAPGSATVGASGSGGLQTAIGPVNGSGVVTVSSGATALLNTDVFVWTYVCI